MTMRMTYEYERLSRVRFHFDESDIRHALIKEAEFLRKCGAGDWTMEISENESTGRHEADLVYEIRIPAGDAEDPKLGRE